MATTTLTSRQQLITVPANTTAHDINFDNVIGETAGEALITMVTGTVVYFTADGTAVGTSSLALASSGNNTRDILAIKRGIKIQFKGGAGSETFNININTR